MRASSWTTRLARRDPHRPLGHLLARRLQLLHEAAPQVQAELAEHVQAAQRLLRPAAPGVLGP